MKDWYGLIKKKVKYKDIDTMLDGLQEEMDRWNSMKSKHKGTLRRFDRCVIGIREEKWVEYVFF